MLRRRRKHLRPVLRVLQVVTDARCILYIFYVLYDGLVEWRWSIKCNTSPHSRGWINKKTGAFVAAPLPAVGDAYASEGIGVVD